MYIAIIEYKASKLIFPRINIVIFSWKFSNPLFFEHLFL